MMLQAKFINRKTKEEIIKTVRNFYEAKRLLLVAAYQELNCDVEDIQIKMIFFRKQ